VLRRRTVLVSVPLDQLDDPGTHDNLVDAVHGGPGVLDRGDQLGHVDLVALHGDVHPDGLEIDVTDGDVERLDPGDGIDRFSKFQHIGSMHSLVDIHRDAPHIHDFPSAGQWPGGRGRDRWDNLRRSLTTQQSRQPATVGCVPSVSSVGVGRVRHLAATDRTEAF